MAGLKCKARPAGKAERANCFFTNATVNLSAHDDPPYKPPGV